MIFLSDKGSKEGKCVSSLLKHQLAGVMSIGPTHVCKFRQAILACLILATFLAMLGLNMAFEKLLFAGEG